MWLVHRNGESPFLEEPAFEPSSDGTEGHNSHCDPQTVRAPLRRHRAGEHRHIRPPEDTRRIVIGPYTLKYELRLLLRGECIWIG